MTQLIKCAMTTHGLTLTSSVGVGHEAEKYGIAIRGYRPISLPSVLTAHYAADTDDVDSK